MFNRELGAVFGTSSERYDRSRIGYPQKLISDVISYTRLKMQANVLEVGCGSGQATKHLAERGFTVLGLDVSSSLVALAEKKFVRFPNVSFESVSFEKAKLSSESFDLVISAQAWHWIDPLLGLPKVFNCLKENGSIALCWYWQDRNENSLLLSQVGEVLEHYNKKKSTIGFFDRHSVRIFEEVKNSNFFRSIERKNYSQSKEFTKKRHHDLMMTFSWIQNLPEKQQVELSNELKKVYEKFEEPLIVPFSFTLILAKKSEK